MRARRLIDRRALSYIELGWGGDAGPCETLLPIDDAEGEHFVEMTYEVRLSLHIHRLSRQIRIRTV